MIRFSRSPEFLEVDPEGAVSLDASARVSGVTHAGQKLLAAAAGVDWRDRDAVLGRPIGDFLDIDVEGPAAPDARPGERGAVMAARDGAFVFAHAIAPPSPRSQAIRLAGSARHGPWRA